MKNRVVLTIQRNFDPGSQQSIGEIWGKKQFPIAPVANLWEAAGSAFGIQFTTDAILGSRVSIMRRTAPTIRHS
jgi:hypothetical protein